ncbi:hypothetical protein [Comamonas sp. JC664]|uniref:hypothetical protein n=1 Tax=Comamonas sp. JC664 TaxID=2801917 RepID=UPI001749F2E1|nr:hypothetical protein [Comamonas sp. JC664]MBL0698966.1 hypothetical protein [Comamonas sp. JC664]GHG79830.1 hypothetical protein GCM10012319_32080 [Comamonas sp. KCTC 72670]
MAERPILFSGPMVQAILAGRKTVTRRVLKPQPEQSDIIAAWRWYGRTFAGGWSLTGTPPAAMLKDCPYGQPGDQLWLRETWALEDCGADGERVVYRADRAAAWRATLGDFHYLSSDYEPGRWRPSIHMPRWASRLMLNVVSIRAERLHAITEEDARAEGVEPDAKYPSRWKNYLGDVSVPDAVDSFMTLWMSINGIESWDANPWVWRVEFRRDQSPDGGAR